MRKRARFFRRVGGALMLAAIVVSSGVPASAGGDPRGSRSIDPDEGVSAQGVERTRVQAVDPRGVEWTRVQAIEPRGVEWTF